MLVILGLLTGGILAGQSLIHAAELRQVSTNLQKYKTATHAFRDKYFAIPGDMPNATSVWGADTGCGSGYPTYTTNATCNGSGNGTVYDPGVAWTARETHDFWNHLAHAGLIEGVYSGSLGGQPWTVTPGVNAPAFPLNSAGAYYVASRDSAGDLLSLFVPDGQLIIYIREFARQYAVLSAADSWNLDTKMDDGLPRTGYLRGGANYPGCIPFPPNDSVYNLSSTTGINGCILAYMIGS